MAVAEWPMIATTQSGSGNADDSAEDDQQVRAGRGYPRQRYETSHHGSGISQETVDNRGLADPPGARQNLAAMEGVVDPAVSRRMSRRLCSGRVPVAGFLNCS